MYNATLLTLKNIKELHLQKTYYKAQNKMQSVDIHEINDKNCSLCIALTAMDPKLQKS